MANLGRAKEHVLSTLALRRLIGLTGIQLKWTSYISFPYPFVSCTFSAGISGDACPPTSLV